MAKSKHRRWTIIGYTYLSGSLIERWEWTGLARSREKAEKMALRANPGGEVEWADTWST